MFYNYANNILKRCYVVDLQHVRHIMMNVDNLTIFFSLDHNCSVAVQYTNGKELTDEYIKVCSKLGILKDDEVKLPA